MKKCLGRGTHATNERAMNNSDVSDDNYTVCTIQSCPSDDELSVTPLFNCLPKPSHGPLKLRKKNSV